MYSLLRGNGWPLCILCSPTGRPYPPSGPGRTGGTRVYPPLCGSAWTLCILVLPRGVPIPHAAQVGPKGLSCIRCCVEMAGPCVSSFSHGASLSPKWPRHDRRDFGVSAAVLDGSGRTGGTRVYPPLCASGWAPCLPCSPTGRPHHPSGPSRTGGTRMHPPLCGRGSTLCILVPPRGNPIPQAAHAVPDGLGCIIGCVGVAGHMHTVFSDGASLSPKWPGPDRRDSGVFAAVWEWADHVYPRSPTGQPYPPSGPRRTGSTGVYPPLCGSGWAHAYLLFRRGVPILKAAQARPEGLECIRCSVGVGGPCVSLFSQGPSLSPKWPGQDCRDSGVSAAVWAWLDLVYPRSPTGQPYTPSGPRKTGSTVVYPPLCGSGWAHGYRLLRRCVPILQVAQAGPEALGCIRRCVGVAGPMHTSFSHGASLSPKRLRQDRRDSGVSAALWEWLDLVYPRSPTGRPYPQSGPGRTGGTRVYPPLCASGWALCILRSPTRRPHHPSGPSRTGGTRMHPPLCGSGRTLCILVPPRGNPILQAAHAGPNRLGCILSYVGVAGRMHTVCSDGASLSPKWPWQERRDSGVSTAVWQRLHFVYPRSPTGRP